MIGFGVRGITTCFLKSSGSPGTWHASSKKRIYPTGHFTFWELQNTRDDVSELHGIRLCLEFQASKLWNVWPTKYQIPTGHSTNFRVTITLMKIRWSRQMFGQVVSVQVLSQLWILREAFRENNRKHFLLLPDRTFHNLVASKILIHKSYEVQKRRSGDFEAVWMWILRRFAHNFSLSLVNWLTKKGFRFFSASELCKSWMAWKQPHKTELNKSN